ncbi:MAG: TRAP transporter small permease subunit [Deltaproteobacteria bacterium]|nr:TRAP transporter small permease subunit [Deltaproteobacteria bacterium]MBL7204585.1 TRAP transporter small permease subunit [Desulfobacteraceae bacterium]
MKKILNFIDNISEWTGRIFNWTVVLLILLVVLEVILRRVFKRPTIWNFEVTIQLYALHFMILAAYALLHKSHVAIDILHEKFSKRTRAILDVTTYLIFFFPFLSVVLYKGIAYAANSWEMNEKSWSVFSPPLYPIKTIIPVMAFLLIIQGCAIFIRQLNIAIKGEEL